MPRLNIKSTKAAFVKELKSLEHKANEAKVMTGETVRDYYVAQYAVLAVAKELEIEIKPEEYK